ncbi:MAG: tRNA epoxyqueuosine(34) reductase QueG [Bryobacteraceae bacterium]|nr:tRNA epoxyqueuosine(34) reductase QueG [Bryobacteraceae bacterium]
MQKTETDRVADVGVAARACGFELWGVARAARVGAFGFYEDWVAGGMAGPMGYLTDHRAGVREDPRRVLASAKSVLCVGKLYKTKDVEVGPGRGRVSRYAWGAEDYHDVMRRDLEEMVKMLEGAWGAFEWRICVDTAPVLERALAREAGLGWIGRNTCLINEPLGSWFFLGEVLVSVDLPAGGAPADRCGTCRRCIDACPTEALVAGPGAPGPEWQLDGRRCISTLTIEQRGPVEEELRAGVGTHLFGCDICQEVCPWNRRSPSTLEAGFQPVDAAPELEELAMMTAEEFRARFRRTPLWRAKYQGLLRNVAVAMGNSGDGRHRAALERLAGSGDAVVEEHARWALKRLEEAAG